MQPEDGQLDAGGGLALYEDQQGSPGRRTQRAAAAKAIDRGKRVAEMILECNEDAEQGEDDVEPAAGGGGGGVEGVPGGVGRGGAEPAGFAGDDDGGGSNGSLYRRKQVKTRWSAAEDAKLKELVDVHGSGNWRLVSGVFGWRTLSLPAAGTLRRCISAINFPHCCFVFFSLEGHGARNRRHCGVLPAVTARPWRRKKALGFVVCYFWRPSLQGVRGLFNTACSCRLDGDRLFGHQAHLARHLPTASSVGWVILLFSILVEKRWMRWMTPRPWRQGAFVREKKCASSLGYPPTVGSRGTLRCFEVPESRPSCKGWIVFLLPLAYADHSSEM